jgi:hypothetical protein
LLARLDDRYVQFVASLPQPQKELAKKKTTFSGVPEELPFEGVSSLNPFMTCTPWLFWESFSGLEDERLINVVEGGAFRSLAMIVMDHLVDHQVEDAKAMAQFHQSLVDHSENIFRGIFDSKSPFWEHYERLEKRYQRGISAELAAQKLPARLDLDSFLIIAGGKVSPIALGLIALAIETEQYYIIGSIETSLKYAAAGTQLLDDIGDWETDVQMGHVTFYLVQLSQWETWDGKHLPSVEELRSRLESDWADIDNLKLVIDFLRKAITPVGDVDCAGWIEYLTSYIELAEKHIKRASIIHLERSLRPLVHEEEDE